MLLVTGICGRTGKYFIEKLIEEKYSDKFRCVVKESTDTSYLDASGLNFEKYIGNITDAEFLQSAMKGITTVLHIPTINFSTYVVKAALKKNIKWLILVHTTGIYSKYKMASSSYKEIEEEIFQLTENKIPLTILRPTMIYGNVGDGNMEKFIKYTDIFKIYPLIKGGKNLLQPINAKDIGYAYYGVLKNSAKTKGKNYILSGEKPITMKFIISEISKNLGQKNIFISFPLGFAHFLAIILKVITLGRIDYIERVLRMGEDRAFTHEDAANDFDFSPMSFEDGIKSEVSQYLKIKGDK